MRATTDYRPDAHTIDISAALRSAPHRGSAKPSARTIPAPHFAARAAQNRMIENAEVTTRRIPALAGFCIFAGFVLSLVVTFCMV